MSFWLLNEKLNFGRDPIVNAMIERAVERKKARLISASGDVKDDNDPSSILMRRMVDAFAEYERLIIGARTKLHFKLRKEKVNVLDTYLMAIDYVKTKYI